MSFPQPGGGGLPMVSPVSRTPLNTHPKFSADELPSAVILRSGQMHDIPGFDLIVNIVYEEMANERPPTIFRSKAVTNNSGSYVTTTLFSQNKKTAPVASKETTQTVLPTNQTAVTFNAPEHQKTGKGGEQRKELDVNTEPPFKRQRTSQAPAVNTMPAPSQQFHPLPAPSYPQQPWSLDNRERQMQQILQNHNNIFKQPSLFPPLHHPAQLLTQPASQTNVSGPFAGQARAGKQPTAAPGGQQSLSTTNGHSQGGNSLCCPAPISPQAQSLRNAAAATVGEFQVIGYISPSANVDIPATEEQAVDRVAQDPPRWAFIGKVSHTAPLHHTTHAVVSTAKAITPTASAPARVLASPIPIAAQQGFQAPPAGSLAAKSYAQLQNGGGKTKKKRSPKRMHSPDPFESYRRGQGNGGAAGLPSDVARP